MIVLVGMPASGKTTVGRLVAARLGLPHIDTDAVIEARAGKSITDIFADEGEAWFRAAEVAAVLDVLSGDDAVVSLGGGAILNPIVRISLAGHRVVWLEVSVTTATRRVGMTALRPLLLGDARARLQTLADERSELYTAVARLRLETDHLTPARVADMVVGYALEGEPEPVRCRVRSAQPYDVIIGRGVRSRLGAMCAGASQVALLRPPVLARQARELARALPGGRVFDVPNGEAAKTPAHLVRCWEALADAGLTRSDVVIGLGGGTTTDLAGFVAATYLRGVTYLSVPTTVLGMVDAAVGGKTGIDLPAGKNLVGAFYEPAAVVCDLELLADLPGLEVAAGLAEVIKTGFIAEGTILERVEADPAAVVDPSSDTFAAILAEAIGFKAGVVSADLREQGATTGRVVLNYGHTMAHAIEAVEHFGWRHGDAVAVGLVYAAEVARRLGLIDQVLVDRHRRVLNSVGLPVTYSAAPWEDLRAAMSHDKKARGATLRWVLLTGVARPVVVADVPESVLQDAYAAIA